MADTTIAWTTKVWNPTRGCSMVSPGCTNCYAMRMAHRFSGPGRPYDGLTRLTKHGPVWTGRARFVPDKLGELLRWRKARRVFVNSMSDLFHEDVTDERIAAVFGVMAACPQHTFQVLTKRPERAVAWFKWLVSRCEGRLAAIPARGTTMPPWSPSPLDHCVQMAARVTFSGADRLHHLGIAYRRPWPLPNVHLGVSVEHQATADERIPLLLQVPAAVRWVSYEPALGPVDLSIYLREHACDEWPQERAKGALGCCAHPMDPLSWLVVGGESGTGARPCDVAWIRSVVRQCREAGVPVFVKQLGARTNGLRQWRDRAGADPDEWPEDLRVREWPR